MGKILDLNSKISNLLLDCGEASEEFENFSAAEMLLAAKKVLSETSLLVQAANELDPKKYQTARDYLLAVAGMMKQQATIMEKKAHDKTL